MSLEEHLKKIIIQTGPVTIAQFMSEILANPEYGYYKKREPFGKDGDFITAPEISQMFGELIGIWAASVWQQMGKPESIDIIEMGPGRGTLMSDFLRGTKNIAGFHEAINICMVEISDRLIQKQKEALSDFSKVSWYKDFNDIPSGKFILIANEFFDALPIHQYVKKSDGWHERMVGLSVSNELQFFLSPVKSQIDAKHKTAKEGSALEINPAAISIVSDISEAIIRHGGAALIIDYGYDVYIYENSFQAVKDHKYHNPLEDLGEADLTALVDFEALKNAAAISGAKVLGTISQATLLNELGISVRANSLKKNASSLAAKDIDAALDRLTSSDKMGELFKAIAIVPDNFQNPAGFYD